MTAGEAKFSDAMSCNVVFCRSTSRSIIENSASSLVVGQCIWVASINRGESGRGLLEQSVDFGNAGLVTTTGEGRIDERVEGLSSDLVTDQPFTEAHHIGVVVLSCEVRRGDVVHCGRSHARDLVGRDRDADAAAADTDTELGLGPGHTAPDRGAVVGVVDRFGAVSA